MTTTERRPRIPIDLAQKIDTARGDVPFERYVRRLLEAHVAAEPEVFVLMEPDIDADFPSGVFITQDAAEEHLREEMKNGLRQLAAEEHERLDLSDAKIKREIGYSGARIERYKLRHGHEPDTAFQA